MELSRELPVAAFSASCFCIVFICFCFELGFGVNMKVVDTGVSLLMPLVWHQNDLQNLSYCQMTAHRSQWIFMNFSTTFPNLKWKRILIGTELVFVVNMKAVDKFVSFPMALVWRENDFWFLSYDENTPRMSYWNLMKIQPFSDFSFMH